MNEDDYLQSLWEERFENDYQIDDGIILCPVCETSYDYCECEDEECF